MDLFHLSDLQRMFGIKQETKDAIEQIYDDIRSEEEWVANVLLSKFVMNAFFSKELGVKKNESQTIYR